MAVCPSCKTHDIERVRSEGLMRIVSSVLPIVKWHCRSCNHEFIRVADSIFTVRRVIVWMLLLIVAFFVWLMQVDSDKFGGTKSSLQQEEQPQINSQGDSIQDERKEDNVSAYLPASVIPDEEPNIILSFHGIDELVVLRPPEKPASEKTEVTAAIKPNSTIPSVLEQDDYTDLEKMRGQLTGLENNLASLTAENRELSSQIASLKINLSASELKTSELEASLNSNAVQSQIEELQAKADASRIEMDRLVSESFGYTTQIQSLESTVSELNTDLKEQIEKQNELVSKNASLSDENESLLEQKEELLAQVETLNVQLAQLKSPASASVESTEEIPNAVTEIPAAEDVAVAPQTAIESAESQSTVDDATDKSSSDSLADNAAKKEVERAVEKWRQYWQAKDIDGYLASYSSTFNAGNGSGVGLEEWRAKRRYIISRASDLNIEISDYISAKVDDSRYIVRFVQTYSSSTYQDEVIKQLVLIDENGQWKIDREESL